ncbi:TetR family transcriptional regulator [Nonomuraea sp. NPDC050394]|uniref:TetR/AcrR family transcriptional regulator n=1 Tax=Nonomuraea sp. NPDC050394 TaxID=3364363 RepID=UPI00378C7E50
MSESGAGRRGRWRSGEQSRRRILDAARARFISHGYDTVTVRSIAADAGVDPAMIHYFFGSKDKLFAAALEGPVSPRDPLDDLLAEGLDGAAARIVRGFLAAFDDAGGMGPLALLRSGQSPEMVREYVEREFTTRLAGHLQGPDTALRAQLITAQLLGLALARYGLRLPGPATASPEDLVTWYAPLIQPLLDTP